VRRGSLRISWEVEETQKSLTELEAVASGRAPAKQGRMCSITVFSSALLERDSGPDPDYSVNASWQHLFKKDFARRMLDRSAVFPIVAPTGQAGAN
jgi:hypothetical protein